MKLTLHKSQVHCSGVMLWWACSSLMSAHLPAESGCRNMRSDCFAVGFYCETIIWQNIFKGSLQVTVASRSFALTWLLLLNSFCQVTQRDSDCW